jgi:hypothetical protein
MFLGQVDVFLFFSNKYTLTFCRLWSDSIVIRLLVLQGAIIWIWAIRNVWIKTPPPRLRHAKGVKYIYELE